jgi:hypothetical protein
MATVKAECGACRGTGLYRGMAEPEGVAVICLTCKGTGCKELTYTPFTQRRRREGVRAIQQSRGSFILNCGPVGEAMTYDEFERRIPSEGLRGAFTAQRGREGCSDLDRSYIY